MKNIWYKIRRKYYLIKRDILWSWDLTKEFYILPSAVLYKNKNDEVKWVDIRFNLFVLQVEVDFYYDRVKTLHLVK